MGSEAEGANAHAEGYYTKANGKNSHAEGQNTLASYENSHASGEFVFTGRKNQTAVGEYNKTVADALFIVGNGMSESDKKNAFEVKEDGRAIIQTVPIDNMDVANKGYVDEQITFANNKITNLIGVGASIDEATDDNLFFVVIDVVID